MYSKHETPRIRGTIYYYDDAYPAALGGQVRDTLEAFGFFPPEKLYADRLTGERFRTYTPAMAELFPRAYGEKEVFSISMASGDSSKTAEFWKFDWYFTFHKSETLAVTPTFRPWNVLSLDTTYGRIQDEENRATYINCLLALIQLIRPFYAHIDDVDKHVQLLKAAGEPHFNPDHIQPICWGNYFGPAYCETFGKDRLLAMPAQVQELGDGVFFSLTDNVLDARTWKCGMARRKIKGYLKPRRN